MIPRQGLKSHLPGRVESGIPDLYDLERMMLHTRQKGAKTPESSAGRHPVVPEVSRPKDPGGGTSRASGYTTLHFTGLFVEEGVSF